MPRLFDLPHAEIRTLLRGGAPVYLPVNPVEYHGPHLSLHNDRLVSLGLIDDLHQGLQQALGDLPLLVADDLEMGVDPCPGPGTRATAHRTVRRTVVSACERLAELGAQRVVLVTFHGSPLHNLALQAGIEALQAHGVQALAPLNLVLDHLVDEDTEVVRDGFEPITDTERRSELFAALPTDFHAGFFETSLSLHYAPESVSADYRDLPPCPEVRPDPAVEAASRLAARLGRARLARELHFMAVGLGWYALRPFPGYTGDPALANRDSGRRFARAVVDTCARHAVEVFEGGRPAPPVLPWLERLTLDGRLGGVHVPLDAIATPEGR